MLPDTIWVGPFCTMPIIRPGGSGWITALTTPPAFGSCAKRCTGKGCAGKAAYHSKTHNKLLQHDISLLIA